MGQYINHTPNGPLNAQNKAADLIKAGAKLLLVPPTQFEENLICVVNNGMFEAATYAYNEREFLYFADVTKDIRPRVWLTWDRVKEYAR